MSSEGALNSATAMMDGNGGWQRTVSLLQVCLLITSSHYIYLLTVSRFNITFNRLGNVKVVDVSS